MHNEFVFVVEGRFAVVGVEATEVDKQKHGEFGDFAFVAGVEEGVLEELVAFHGASIRRRRRLLRWDMSGFPIESFGNDKVSGSDKWVRIKKKAGLKTPPILFAPPNPPPKVLKKAFFRGGDTLSGVELCWEVTT